VSAGGARRAAVWLATGFGLGYSPFASGTVGTLPGVAIVLLVWSWTDSILLQSLLALALTAAAVPLCSTAEAVFGTKDDGRIVADEYLTFPICMIGLPLARSAWWLLPMAFVTCRVFDILKPPPAYQVQRLPRGWGIVVDDVFASLYSLAANHLLFRWLAER
jgi:phosphatidylglycerophosphatase A